MISLDLAQQQRVLALARWGVAEALSGRATLRPAPGPWEDYLREPRGCFVTLHHRHGRLRGCIGLFEPVQPLGESILSMAGAACRDPRFIWSDPVVLAEINDLVIEVSILTPLTRIEDPAQMRIGTDGICIRGRREGKPVSGCYLPQVAVEQGWTADQTLTSCCAQKMGLAPDAWRAGSGLEFYVFQSQAISEANVEMSQGAPHVQ